MFYRLQSIICWFLQIVGGVMAVGGSAAAIYWATEGQNGDALFACIVALVGIGAIAAGGWIRKGAKKERDFFGL
jgi:hypothetical protein